MEACPPTQQPTKRFWRSLGTALSLVMVFHFFGMCVSFLVFSWQYAKAHGFVSWLLLGEIVPFAKSLAWEVFLISALLRPSQPAKPAEGSWWQPEYPALVRAVGDAPNGSLFCSYRSGPRGQSQVSIALFRRQEGLVLQAVLPKEGLTSWSRTGGREPVKTPIVLTMRDHNLDGLPDDARVDEGKLLGYQAATSAMEFRKLGRAPEDQGAVVLWSLAMAFSVNHFLHGTDSAFAP